LLDNNYSEQYDRILKFEELNNINTICSETTELVNKEEEELSKEEEELSKEEEELSKEEQELSEEEELSEEDSDEILVEDVEEEYLNGKLENDGSVTLTSNQKKNQKKRLKKKEKRKKENENELDISQRLPDSDLF